MQPKRVSPLRAQGSTYLYIHHLSPFLTAHEHDIDAALADARTSATRAGLGYANAAARRIRAALLGSVLGGDEPAQQAAGDGPGAGTTPPVLAEPGTATPASASGAGAAQLAHLAGGLLRTYAPAALAAGHALLHPMGTAAADGAATSARAEQGGGARRRAVGGQSAGAGEDSEREDSDASGSSGVGSGQAHAMSASSSFEEIARDEARGFSSPTTGAAGTRRKSGGWFGWGATEEGVGEDKKNA